MFNDNKLLGQFNLDGIPPAPRGVPQEEITVDVDANGIINVTAKDLGTDKEAHITITASSGLSKEEIERARKDAELNAEVDKKRAELVNVKNSTEALCFSIEKSLKDNSGKVADDEKKAVEDALKSTSEAIASDDLQKIKDAAEALNKAWEPVVKKIYAATSGANSTGGQQFDPTQAEEFMKAHPEMFKDCGPFAGASFNSSASADNDTVDAEPV